MEKLGVLVEMKVLVVDGDEYTLDSLAHLLTREGHTVTTARDGREALALWRKESPDLILAEADLPHIGGYELCIMVRDSAPTPFILFDERQGEADILRAFDAGADDYLVKPFSPRILLARINAVTRRSPVKASSRERLVVGDLALNPENSEVEGPEGRISLSPTEFEVLYILASNEGKVITTERIAESLWGSRSSSSLELVKNHIGQIRKKLESEAANPRYVITVPGIGYTLSSSRLESWFPGAALQRR